MLRHARAPFPVPDRKDLPPGLADVLGKLTAKKPEDRYQTPAEAAAALAPFAVRPANPPSPRPLPAIRADEAITEDTLPAPAVKEASTATRFALPHERPRPAVRKGCLPVVLLGIAFVVAGWLAIRN
jgi:hypothetical protein